MTSYDVRIYAIETRKRQTTRYRVRWTVAGKRFGETFAAKGLAESYRAALITAARRGEAFSTDSGLPESLERERRDVSFYAHCLEFAGMAWPMYYSCCFPVCDRAAAQRGSVVRRDGYVVSPPSGRRGSGGEGCQAGAVVVPAGAGLMPSAPC